MNYDIGFSALNGLLESPLSSPANRNEASTRLQLIDRMLFECLGWQRSDCDPEHCQQGEYADYVLKTSVRAIVVEAKREGIAFELPAGTAHGVCRLSYFADNFSAVFTALKQVAGYAQKRGVVLAVATNGHQYVGFVAVRDDGIPPLEGDAFVFASLTDIQQNFLPFWNAFSRDGVQQRWLRQKLLEQKKVTIPLKLSRSIPGYPGIQRRNSLQTDIQIVAEIVFEDLAKAKELNEQFLTECYCESGALSQYALVSRTILETRYDALFGNTITDPSVAPAVAQGGNISSDLLAENISKRPILLIGDVGVGKSSFINYFTHVHLKDVKNKSIVIYIDLGRSATLTHDLRQYVLTTIEDQLLNSYGVDIQDAALVKAIYWPETKRFATSITGLQYKEDPTLYHSKLVENLAHLASQKEQHLIRALQHFGKSQRRQIIVFIDNADQRSADTQQKAFLVAEELSQSWHATVFVALRPETFHKSVRSGSLSGYHPKAFTIAPPRIDKVINKRLDFGLKLASGSISPEGFPKNIQINLNTLATLLRVLHDSFEKNENLIEALDNISCGNARRALDLVRDFLSSGHVNTQKIIDIVAQEGGYIVPTHEFMRALIHGNSVYYDPTRSEFSNIFDIRFADPKDHFSTPLLLGVLMTRKGVDIGDQGWVPMLEIINVLQGIGYTDEQVFQTISAATQSRVIDFTGPEEIKWASVNSTKLRINSRGAYHHQRLASKFYYVDAVIVDTPVLDVTTRKEMCDAQYIDQRLTRAVLFIKYLSDCWRIVSNGTDLFNWPDVEKSLLDDIENISRRVATKNVKYRQ